MTSQALGFRFWAGIADFLRDRKIPLPEGVAQKRDLSYGPHGRANRLDVYFPQGAAGRLPTIVSVHGGGYVYGNKEIYRRYCMDLARRGFAVVNFNYRLAPRWKFPTPLEDLNRVLTWLTEADASLRLDPERVALVGDSAGAQLASQYAAIWENPEYAALFSFRVPRVTLRALGLNCGMYDLAQRAKEPREGIQLDYFGDLAESDPRLRELDAIGSGYPPAYLATACNDFLREAAEPMYRFLREKGVEAAWKCYGREEDKQVAHVFHVNLPLPEAKACNDDECAFFRKYL